MEWELMVAEEYCPCPFVVHGGGLLFSAPSFFLLHRINRELLFSKELFSKAPARFNIGLLLSKKTALPNGVIVSFPRSAQFSYHTYCATICCFNVLALEPP
jgi:hypothetical protein